VVSDLLFDLDLPLMYAELKSTSAGKLFQTFISLSQKKELRIPELYGL